MIGGLKQTTSRLAIAAAAGMFAGGIALTPAQAADLGGDCCADLEERVAELEATTVRKGNRKVSVKLSGQVNRQVYWWDDGVAQDVYFADNGYTHTRFRLTGSATISEGRTAGFIIENDLANRNDPVCLTNSTTGVAGNNNSNGKTFNCQNTDGRKQDLWVKDERLGKISLGRGDTASESIAEIDLSGTGVGHGVSGAAYNNSAFVYRTAAGLSTTVTVGGAAGSWTNLDGGGRQSRVRYDTPTFGGFTLSSSVWADDNVDFALRYAKEWNSVRCAMGIGTVHQTAGRNNQDNWQTSGSASCLHTPSGLNLTYAAGSDDESSPTAAETSFWWIKGGISRRWNSHGKTSIAVSYGETEDKVTIGDKTETWGIFFVQNIDAAAMEVYTGYQNFSYDDTATALNYLDNEYAFVGARIRF